MSLLFRWNAANIFPEGEYMANSTEEAARLFSARLGKNTTIIHHYNPRNLLDCQTNQ